MSSGFAGLLVSTPTSKMVSAPPPRHQANAAQVRTQTSSSTLGPHPRRSGTMGGRRERPLTSVDFHRLPLLSPLPLRPRLPCPSSSLLFALGGDCDLLFSRCLRRESSSVSKSGLFVVAFDEGDELDLSEGRSMRADLASSFYVTLSSRRSFPG